MTVRLPSAGAVELLANLAAILTAIIASVAWTGYVCSSWRKRKKLETYLRDQKVRKPYGPDDNGQRSLLHVIARVGLTESEVLHASFKSRYIKRLLTTSAATHLANDLLFEYDASGGK